MHGRSSVVSSTNALLARANCQLRGERVISRKQTEGHELEDYLSSLGKKQTHELQWDKFGESDLSLSSDDQEAGRHPSSKALEEGSRFLKKKPVDMLQDDNNDYDRKTTGTKDKFSDMRTPGLEKAARYTSKPKTTPSLEKANQFTSKFQAKQDVLVLSDSDLDISLSLDEDVIKEVKTIKTAPRGKVKPVSGTGLDEDDSVSLGKDGSRFLKRPVTEPKDARPTQGVKLEQTTPMQRTASGSRSGGGVVFKIPEVDDQDDSSGYGHDASRFLKKTHHDTRKVRKYSNNSETDDDSIMEVLPTRQTPQSPRSPKTPRGILKNSARTPRTPSPLLDVSEVGDYSLSQPDHVDSDSSDGVFKVNLMDLDTLGPLLPVENNTVKSDKSKAVEIKEPKNKNNKKNANKTAEVDDSDFFSRLGLHTTDELFGSDQEVSDISEVLTTGSSEIKTEATGDYESDFDPISKSTRSPTPLRSILSPSPRPTTPKSGRSRVRLSLENEVKIRSRSPSPEAISTARTSYAEEIDEESAIGVTETIKTEECEEDSFSENTLSSISESSPRKSFDDYYSTDFTSTAELTPRKSVRSSRRRSRQSDATAYSDNYSTYSESTDRSTRSPSPVLKSKSRAVKTKSTEVQTGLDLGDLVYQWGMNTPAALGPEFGLSSVDPTPIASHVVSADALEEAKLDKIANQPGEVVLYTYCDSIKLDHPSLTGYSPSVIAMNDMLRQQLQLTSQFIGIQKHLHQAALQSIESDHKYTTLQDTKRYIKKHKKKILTFDEALKQVKADMGMQ